MSSPSAAKDSVRRIEIIGIGHQKSRGVKNGVITDLDAAESVVRLAVDVPVPVR